MRLLIALLPIIVPPVLNEFLRLEVSPAQLILTTSDRMCSHFIQLSQALPIMNLESLYRLLSYPHFDFSPYWTLPTAREGRNGGDLTESTALLDSLQKAGGQSVLRWLIPLKTVQMTPLGLAFLLKHLSTGELLSLDYPLEDLNLSSLSSANVEALLSLLLKHPMPTLGSSSACRHILSLGNLQFLETQSRWSLINMACLRDAITRAGQWFQGQYIQFARLLQAAALQNHALADLAFYKLVALAAWSQGDKVRVVCAELLAAFKENPSVLQHQILDFFDPEQESNVRQAAFAYIRRHRLVPPNLQPIFALEHLLVALLLPMPLNVILPALYSTLASYTPRQVPAFLVQALLSNLKPGVYINHVATDLSPFWTSLSSTLSRHITDYLPESLLGPEERLDLWRRRHLRLKVLGRTELIFRGRIEYLQTGFLGEADAQDNIIEAKLIEAREEIIATAVDGTIRFDCSRKHKEQVIVWWRGRLLQLLIQLRPFPALNDTLMRIVRSGYGLFPPPIDMVDAKSICIQRTDGESDLALGSLARLMGDLSQIGGTILNIVNSHEPSPSLELH